MLRTAPLPRRFAIRRILALICLSLVVAVGMPQAANAAARVALVIGNSAYQRLPKPGRPANDAAAMAALFRKLGYVVKEAKNLGFFAFKDAIYTFKSGASAADVAVVYFSGQGIGLDGVNYLLPTDARLTSDDDAAREGINLESILSAVVPARQLGLVILDASRARALVEVNRHTTQAAGNSGARPANSLPANVLVASSAKPGSTTKDGDGPSGAYTAALLKHLAEPGIDVAVAFGRIHDDVIKATGNKQAPVVYGSLDGQTVALVPPANSQ
jgi:uncharacterized caspase-like protein